MNTTDDQQELFYWVDEQDRVLGSITRAEAHGGSFKIHRGIWVMVFNRNGELFLQKRSLSKDLHAGLWSISVGGHVTYDQTYEEAARREFVEELGIKASPLKLLGKFRFSGKKETEIDCVYRSRHNGPFELNQKEIDRGEFFAPSVIEESVRSAKMQVSNWALAIMQAELGILSERPERGECIIKMF